MQDFGLGFFALALPIAVMCAKEVSTETETCTAMMLAALCTRNMSETEEELCSKIEQEMTFVTPFAILFVILLVIVFAILLVIVLVALVILLVIVLVALVILLVMALVILLVMAFVILLAMELDQEFLNTPDQLQWKPELTQKMCFRMLK